MGPNLKPDERWGWGACSFDRAMTSNDARNDSGISDWPNCMAYGQMRGPDSGDYVDQAADLQRYIVWSPGLLREA